MHVALIEFRTSTPYPIHLANALSHHLQVTLLMPNRATDLLDFVDTKRVNLIPFDMPRIRQLANLSFVWRLRQRLQSIEPNLVHITYWHPWGSLGLGRFSSIPVVATVHDVTRHMGERGRLSIPSTIYRWQWQWADQVIVHSSDAKSVLQLEFGLQPDQVHMIPIGAYEYYRSFDHDVECEDPTTLLFFGRIWGYKGLQVLIDAEPLISKHISDLRIIIAGEGEPFGKYERSMINSQHFEVHNYRISDDRVAGLFRQASVIILPYLEASQSGVVSIAYAFGKPVIATRVGGLPDVVQDGLTGYLVPPNDPGALAEAAITLLEDADLRRQMGQAARRIADTDLSWEQIAHKTMNVYKTSAL